MATEKRYYVEPIMSRRGCRDAMRFRHRKVTGHYKLEPDCAHDLTQEPVLPEPTKRALWKAVKQMVKQPAANRASETSAHRRDRRETSLAGRARITRT